MNIAPRGSRKAIYRVLDADFETFQRSREIGERQFFRQTKVTPTDNPYEKLGKVPLVSKVD